MAWLLGALLPIVSSAHPADSAPTGTALEFPLFLEVSLNRQPSDRLWPFVQRDGRLHATPETLRALGLKLPDDAAGKIALESLPGIAFDYDVTLQRLALFADLDRLDLDTTVIDVAQRPRAKAENTPGLLINYNLHASRHDGADTLHGWAELRAFGRGTGVFGHSLIGHYADAGIGGRQARSTRLDTWWRMSFQESLVGLEIGDVESGALGWNRSLRLGGLRIGSDFGLRPYLATSPLPIFHGEIQTPSQVDLYVDNIRHYSGSLPVGPFRLTTLPGISGQGMARLVITDAFGRSETLEFPFYLAPQLLAHGLTDWSLSLGVARRDYGLRSFAYSGQPLASFGVRHGLDDRLTLESHAEAGAGLRQAGLGATWLPGAFGTFSGAYARSRWHDRAGSMRAAAYVWNGAHFHVALSHQHTQGEFHDLASLHGHSTIRRRDSATLGWSDPAIGALGASYNRTRLGRQARESRHLQAYWHRRQGRWHFGLTLRRDLDRPGDLALLASLSLTAENGHRLATQFERDADRRTTLAMDASRPISGDHGHGWRLSMQQQGADRRGSAEFSSLTGFGRLQGGIAHTGHGARSYLAASGSLVYAHRHLFAARSVGDAFAVVSTDGVPGVPVKLENRPVGATDARGLLLVAPLRAWETNRIGIDTMDLPANMRVDAVERQATPGKHAGTLVRFGMTPTRSAIVVLRDESGRFLPAGSRVSFLGRETTPDSHVGHDGEAWLENLESRNTLRVTSPDGRCIVRFDYPHTDSPIPRIGPLTCRREDAT